MSGHICRIVSIHIGQVQTCSLNFFWVTRIDMILKNLVSALNILRIDLNCSFRSILSSDLGLNSFESCSLYDVIIRPIPKLLRTPLKIATFWFSKSFFQWNLSKLFWYYLINEIFWNTLFSKIGPHFCWIPAWFWLVWQWHNK